MERHTHLGVYGILIRNNQILLIKKSRGPHKGKWDLPGEKIEFGEEPYSALQREFHEETGMREIEGSIRTALSYTLIYSNQDEKLEELHHIGILYNVKLLNENYELKIDGDGHDSHGAKWFSLEALNDIEATPFVRELSNMSMN